MKNNETGEYELVVGNPQLLSGFFIVVLLLGVAFVMGYVVGQNSPRSGKAQAQTAVEALPPAAQDARSQAASQPPVSQPAEAQQPDAGAAEGSDQQAEPAPPRPTTQPALDVPAAAPVAAPAAQDQPAGSSWQVMAVRQASDAQSLLQTLKDGGMPAFLQTGPDGWVRLMVGPYKDRESLAAARTALEDRFQIRNPIRR